MSPIVHLYCHFLLFKNVDQVFQSKPLEGQVSPSGVKSHNFTAISGPSLTKKAKNANKQTTQQQTIASSKEEEPDPFFRELNNDEFC